MTCSPRLCSHVVAWSRTAAAVYAYSRNYLRIDLPVLNDKDARSVDDREQRRRR
jgi:hypothetical protein